VGVAGGRLISCASVGREEVRYALGGLEERIVVAEYRRQLPSEAAIGARLGRAGGMAPAAGVAPDEPDTDG